MQAEDAAELISIARKAIAYFLATGRILKEQPPNKKFESKKGVFVTLLKFPSGELRGCIGFVEPVYSIWEATINAALAAAFQDPRFTPLQASELDKITLEISILTQPKELKCKAEQRPSKIEIGRHGLIIKSGFSSGLLLPQVAVEYNWTPEEFLSHCCAKAGLSNDCLLSEDVKLFLFEAEVFKEEKPNGKVVRHQ
ncbi:MAG: TIGR00296 family protein [Candidatus Diapherotrites archaeon]|nr:TIGR00296 family protein [Candidatus Diapherotrites archaeon]